MGSPSKILLVDDDAEFAKRLQSHLQSRTEPRCDVLIAATGKRALASISSDPFALMVVELQVPQMDGLQLLSVARRKCPHLKLMVLTRIRDEQFRARAYSLGVDQYWMKPGTDAEYQAVIDSISSLLARSEEGGFRGVQSKTLPDIIQLECLTGSTSLLKVVNGIVEGRMWFHKGDVVDAESGDLKGESAFQRILSWKAGSFELLPGDAERPRSIHVSYQGLLLNTAQAIDEAASQALRPEGAPEGAEVAHASSAPLLAELSQLPGVEFFLAVGTDRHHTKDYWGLDQPDAMADWSRETLKEFHDLGEDLHWGGLRQVLGFGPQRHVALAPCAEKELCVGFQRSASPDQIRDTMKTVLTKWAS